MLGLKLSVSLPAEDVEVLDAYASEHAAASRSAVLHEAIQALRLRGLGEAYRAALDEWLTGEDAESWDATSGDGL